MYVSCRDKINMDQLKFRYLTDEILIVHAISTAMSHTALPKVPLYFNGNVFRFKTRDIIEQRTKSRE